MLLPPNWNTPPAVLLASLVLPNSKLMLPVGCGAPNVNGLLPVSAGRLLLAGIGAAPLVKLNVPAEGAKPPALNWNGAPGMPAAPEVLLLPEKVKGAVFVVFEPLPN